MHRLQPDKSEPPKATEEGHSDRSIIYKLGASFLSELNNEQDDNSELPSFQDVNNWSQYKSKCLEDKLIELASICEQITQL